ncbi:hypothetical protein [Bacillus sp. B15-48]|uniref:hypothetical protein n=1 Tax=Bacillus sp. B15-48 TaxID=1548601 RepID=UPI00193FD23C|nr:hypothetical protein [Bacillus sp. B15-48]MBM4762729.1 hypothetical protein [Bacillus sp. B15-48]
MDVIKRYLEQIETFALMYFQTGDERHFEKVETAKKNVIGEFEELKQAMNLASKQAFEYMRYWEKSKNENEKLKAMIKEGITFEDLYNPDNEIDPQCR